MRNEDGRLPLSYVEWSAKRKSKITELEEAIAKQQAFIAKLLAENHSLKSEIIGAHVKMLTRNM